MADLHWSNEMTLKFLEMYEEEPVIWDTTHPLHKDKRAINDAWNRLQIILEKSVTELKKKKESLMTTYRLLLKKHKNTNEFNKPTWFAFQIMDRFLSKIYQSDFSMYSQDTIISQQTEFEVDDDNPTKPLTLKERGSLRTIRRRSTPNPPKKKRRKVPSDDEEYQPQEVSTPPQPKSKKPFETLNVVLNKQEEDECDLFGKLIAKKLRKLSEIDREEVMYEIEGILFQRSRRREASESAVEYNIISDVNRPSSAQSCYSVSPTLPTSPINDSNSETETKKNISLVKQQISNNNLQDHSYPSTSVETKHTIQIISGDEYIIHQNPKETMVKETYFCAISD